MRNPQRGFTIAQLFEIFDISQELQIRYFFSLSSLNCNHTALEQLIELLKMVPERFDHAKISLVLTVDQGPLYSPRDPYVWKNFSTERQSMIFKSIYFNGAKRQPFHAQFKLMSRSRSLEIENVKICDYFLYPEHLKSLKLSAFTGDFESVVRQNFEKTEKLEKLSVSVRSLEQFCRIEPLL